MKMIVFNASSFGRRGITSMVLHPFLSGAREAGAMVDEVVVNKLSIHFCRGDLSCWFRTRGECIQDDDMKSLLPRIRAADCVVFSMPVFCDGVPGKLKTIMDRFVALGNPLLEIRDNHTCHPLQEGQKKKFVLIASCGLWEIDNFNPALTHMQAFCRNVGYEFTGALIRPHSFAMRTCDVNDICAASKKAGTDLVKNGTIPLRQADIVSREILAREDYIDQLNNRVGSLMQ
jgi:multimeric flavodoxin WrbA